MTRAARRARFVRKFLSDFLREQSTSGRLPVAKYHSLLRDLRRGSAQLAAKLYGKRGQSLPLPGGLGSIRLIDLRECNGRSFDFIQALPSAKPTRRLTCFIGHRFAPGIERNLRYNLSHLLEPYNVRLIWSGYDLQAANLFSDIVKHIRNCSMCIFDNRGTLSRPNVYIEVGVAFASKRPMMVCEYTGASRRGLETGSVPSDLTGLVRITYKTYEELSWKLYFGLPAFVARNRLLTASQQAYSPPSQARVAHAAPPRRAGAGRRPPKRPSALGSARCPDPQSVGHPVRVRPLAALPCGLQQRRRSRRARGPIPAPETAGKARNTQRCRYRCSAGRKATNESASLQGPCVPERDPVPWTAACPIHGPGTSGNSRDRLGP